MGILYCAINILPFHLVYFWIHTHIFIFYLLVLKCLYVGESVKYVCKIANRQLLVKCYDNKTGVVTLQLGHLSIGLASGG